MFKKISVKEKYGFSLIIIIIIIIIIITQGYKYLMLEDKATGQHTSWPNMLRRLLVI